MGLSNKGIQIVENLNNKPDDIKIGSLSGYDAIRETLQ